MAKQKETKDTDLSMQLEHFVSSGKIKKAKLKYDVGDRNGCILAAARLASESGEDYYVFATGLRWKATPTSVGTSKNTIKAQGGLRITPQGEVFVIEHPFKSQASTETTALSIPKPKDNNGYNDYFNWQRYRNVLTDFAEKFGYKEIGSGCSGFVLYKVKDPFFVIKVFSDSAYGVYVNLCSTKLKGNPYVPVFKGKPVKIAKNTSVYAIRIEHLSPLLRVKDNDNLVLQTRQLLKMMSIKQLSDQENMENVVTKYLAEHKVEASKLYENDPNYKKFVLEMIGLLRQPSLRFDVDIYPENTMQRRQQIVFVDPICNK